MSRSETAEREYLVEESLSHLEQEFAIASTHPPQLPGGTRLRRGFERQAQDDSGEAGSGWAVQLNGIDEEAADQPATANIS